MSIKYCLLGKLLACYFSLWFVNTSPELKTSHGHSLTPLSFDCSRSIFAYMLLKYFFYY